MDIRQLRYFARIVELGSLTKASRTLHVAQPALSQQVAKLEEDVGKPLLIRSSKGVIPNQAGKTLYHHARLILRQFDQALAIARSDRDDVQGIVSVGLPATTVAAIGLPLTKRIRAHYPGISLNVVEAMSGHLENLIRQNQLDLAVLFSRDMPDDLSVEPLMVEELFMIVAGDSEIGKGRDSVTMREASQIPLILPTSKHGLRRRIEVEFESRALHPRLVAEIDSLSLVMNCVQDDIGATIKPMGAIMLGATRGQAYRFLKFEDAQLRRSNFLYSLPPESLSPAAALVASEIRDCVAELLDNPKWDGFFPSPDSAPSAVPARDEEALSRPIPA